MPAKKTAAPTSARAWKGKQGVLVELPSGNVARVKTPGMPAFLRAGVIPDTLTPIVRKMMTGKAGQDEVTEALQGNDQAIEDLLRLYDVVTVEAMVEPAVLPTPLRNAARDLDALYVDEIAFDDKAFIFSVAVGGTTDLETFRSEQEQALASLQPRTPVEGQTVGTAGDH